MDYEEVKLPENWSMHFDESKNCYYYYHKPSGTSQWDYPIVDFGSPMKTQNHLENILTSAADLSTSSSMPDYMLAKPVSPVPSSLRSDFAKSGVTAMTNYYSDMDGSTDDDLDDADNGHNLVGGNEWPPGGSNETTDSHISSRYTLPFGQIRKSEDVIVGGMNQDYLGMARTYKLQRAYSDHYFNALCVLCHKNECTDVFFPCQHRCVCRHCIRSEQICDDRTLLKNPRGHCNCPLCSTIINLILPHENGKEVDKYWAWVHEIVPPLPRDFMRNFKHSAAVLETIYVKGKGGETWADISGDNNQAECSLC